MLLIILAVTVTCTQASMTVQSCRTQRLLQNIQRAFILTVRIRICCRPTTQASADGIGQKVVELERIVSGTDRTIVEKNSEYERAGKTGSKKGRLAGSELVQLYADHGMNDEALALALELLNYQKDGDEMYYAAQNADFVAGYYYKSGESKKAAEYYLKAAEYYRSSGRDETDKAAAALYSATDAFMAAGLKGDAEVTAKTLVELYPDTKQGSKVMNLVK